VGAEALRVDPLVVDVGEGRAAHQDERFLAQREGLLASGRICLAAEALEEVPVGQDSLDEITVAAGLGQVLDPTQRRSLVMALRTVFSSSSLEPLGRSPTAICAALRCRCSWKTRYVKISTRSAQLPSISTPTTSRTPSTLRAATSEGAVAWTTPACTAAAATSGAPPGHSLRSTTSISDAEPVTRVPSGSVTTTGAGDVAGSWSTTTGGALGVADTPASFLVRRQRSRNTTPRATKARIPIATPIGRPAEEFEPFKPCEDEALVDAAAVCGSGWPTHGGVRCVATATGGGKLRAKVAGALTSRVEVPVSAV
jgi:hypothetical protein